MTDDQWLMTNDTPLMTDDQSPTWVGTIDISDKISEKSPIDGKFLWYFTIGRSTKLDRVYILYQKLDPLETSATVA